MQLTARNQLKGKIKELKGGPFITELILDVNGTEIVSNISTNSVKTLELKVGDEAVAVINAESVIIASK